MENGSLQYENQILKSELEAEHFILTQMAELGKVRNVRECQVAINNLLEKIGHFTKADRAYIVDEKDLIENKDIEDNEEFKIKN